MKIAANLLQFADHVSTARVDVHIVMLTNTAGLSCPEPLPPDPLAQSALSSVALGCCAGQGVVGGHRSLCSVWSMTIGVRPDLDPEQEIS